MNASSFLVLALAVFGASAAPSCFNSGSGFSGAGQLTLALAPSASYSAAPATFAAAPATFTAAPATFSAAPATFSAAPATFSAAPATFSAAPASFSTLAAASAAPSCVTPLQGQTSYLQAGPSEGSNTFLPALVPSTSVSRSCHCLKTFVRPQIRTEVITVPTVDRLTRIVNNPIVEVQSSNAGGHNRRQELPTCGGASAGQSWAASGSSAQAYAAPAMTGPIMATPALTAPAMTATAYSTQSYAAPALSAQSYAAPALSAAPALVAAPAEFSGAFESNCNCNNNLF